MVYINKYINYTLYIILCSLLYANHTVTLVVNVFQNVLIFQLSWAESLEICESISGRLAEFHDILTFYKVIRHIQRNGKMQIALLV